MNFRTLLCIATLMFFWGCQQKADKSSENNATNIHTLYDKFNIKSVEMRYVGPDRNSLGYRLILHPNGTVKDSIIEFTKDNPQGEGFAIYSFHPNGKESKFLKKIVQNHITMFQPVYEFEGRNYNVNSMVEEYICDNKGRYLSSRIQYNDSHEFKSEYIYTDSSRTEIKYGPIGDIMAHRTYFIDAKGNDYKLKNNLTGNFEKLSDYSIHDKFSMGNKNFEIVKFGYDDDSEECYVNIEENLTDRHTIHTRISCEIESSIADIKNNIMNNKTNSFYLVVKTEKIMDENGNVVLDFTINANLDTVLYTRREFILNEDSSIRQINSFNQDGTPDERQVNTYDDEGRLTIKKIINLKENTIYTEEYIYDHRGLLLEEKNLENGKWTGSTKYTYN